MLYPAFLFILLWRTAEFMNQADPAQFRVISALKFNIQAGIVSKFPKKPDKEPKFGPLLDIYRPITGKVCIAIYEMEKRPKID